MAKQLSRKEIVALLNRNDEAVERALLVVFKNQTNSEKETNTSIHHNGEGFGKSHARLFSTWAKQILHGEHLSPAQLAFLRQWVNGNTRIGRYWEQLQKEADRKAAAEARKATQMPNQNLLQFKKSA